MPSLRRPSSLFLALFLLAPALLPAASYRIDSSESRVEVLVLRGGLLGFFGHDHEIVSRKLTGTIDYNPSQASALSAEVSLPARSLTVVDPEEPVQDRKQVQSTMRGERVLDVARYPEIHFASTEAAPANTPGRILISGDLALHGTVKRISFPVRLSSSAGTLRVGGVAKVRQSDFGIEPIRYAGGAIRIKDQVEIHFTVLARELPPARP